MDDRVRVAQLLGREPRGAFDVVVRDDHGDPVVVRNAPLLDDGTPMPTRYYLVGADLVARVSRLEADGGVRRAEAAIDAGSDRGGPSIATPPSATRPSPSITSARDRTAASAAPGWASSASTPTSPTRSPAATTRSGGGRWPSSATTDDAPGNS